MTTMPGQLDDENLALLRSTLQECRNLYISSGQLCAQQYPQLISQSGHEFVQLMDDLHKALVLKIYVMVCEADKRWSAGERAMAEVLFEHLWHQRLTGDNLVAAARKAAEESSKLQWYSIIRPFDRVVPLRERIGTLETIVMRLANLIGRADGELGPQEAAIIHLIRDELQHHLRPVPIDEPTAHEEPHTQTGQAIATMQRDAGNVHAATRLLSNSGTDINKVSTTVKAATEARPTLEDTLKELHELIGLGSVKDEVQTLVNFLKLQQRRGEAGLGDTEVSLHMVFTGNPGTGKTSVARILGKIFGAMGILKKGQLVETDRSGLVAGYMGQTGPKANSKIDEALDGVLFIDEAYSLVAQETDDAYGNEAVQILLKRAEDDRQRLIVIMAGYPAEMQTLLKTNPGLTSRFNRVLNFEDYSPLEMAQIFGLLCDKNKYKLAEGTRAKLVLGFVELHRNRDRNFGNGRVVRNIFEQAIRRMANRIANIRELSADALMLFQADDIEFKDLPTGTKLEYGDDGPWRFRLVCPACSHASKSRGSYLGKKVRCPKCQHDFKADWGEPVPAEEHLKED
ncbi:MAG TPA: AAA family ATPase [Lacipirellulaceae bacterium]|jgi:SpoVK/Ycf46/Vps4 family AAA+-type ATPase|nr:AAA family ATPase [Lacipirellulaceae bacterium]